MKIFISHSSKNSNYGNALVDLLIGVGIRSDHIVFTSNDAHGIPIGQNIFTWLKNEINEKPHVLYLLSPEYYTSVACLNEMGAAWVVENEHTMIFTPDFNLDSHDFKNGALDHREIGFHINNENRIIAFIDSLKLSFPISTNQVFTSQKIRKFLDEIALFQTTVPISKPIVHKQTNSFVDEKTKHSSPVKKTDVENSNPLKNDPASRFFSDLLSHKLKDEDVILTHYVMEMAKCKLKTGWQEDKEIQDIIAWEDVNELNNTLSSNYARVLRRLEMRKLTEVTKKTDHGNPKEVSFIESMLEQLTSVSDEITSKVLGVVDKNKKTASSFPF